MIEKYRQCDATIVDMVDKVSEIERRLAEQEPVSENPNGLRNQINIVKVSTVHQKSQVFYSRFA